MRYTFVTDLDINICRKKFNEPLKKEVANGIEGDIDSSNGKTVIKGKFKMSLAMKILAIYFNIFFLSVEMIAIFSWKDSDMKKKALTLLLIVIGHALFNFIPYVLSKFNIKEEKYILKFLLERFKAKNLDESGVRVQ